MEIMDYEQAITIKKMVSSQQNAELNRLELTERKLILESKPQVVFVELSRRCNLSCPMCHRWTLPRSSFIDMSDELIDLLIENYFPTAKIVDLHGLGESTLHPRFVEVVHKITNLGSRVRVISNLNAIMQDQMQALVDTDAFICFSLGAVGQEAYSKIYARGNFEILVNNLKTLQGMREQSGTCQDMSCLSMISLYNIAHLPDVMRLVADHGVKHHRIFPMYLKENDKVFGYVGKNMDIWNEALNKAFDLADQLGMELRVIDWPVANPDSSKTLINHTCHRPWSHIHINVDGRVGLCDYNEQVDTMSALMIQNMSFDQIWNSKAYQNIREAFKDGEPSKGNSFCGDVCRKTKYVDFDDVIFPELASRILSNKNREI